MSRPAARVVVILDDEASLRTVVARLLAGGGFLPLEAATLDELAQLAQQHDVDAFLIDVHLIGESGLSALPQLRSQRKYSQAPILILTGDRNLSDDDHAVIRQHRAHVFYKGVPLQVLLDYVRQLVADTTIG